MYYIETWIILLYVNILIYVCPFLGNYLQNRGYKTDILRVTRFNIDVYKCNVARGYVNQSTWLYQHLLHVLHHSP